MGTRSFIKVRDFGSTSEIDRYGVEAKKLYLVFCVLNSSPLPQLLIGLHPVRPRDHETVELRHRLPRAPIHVPRGHLGHHGRICHRVDLPPQHVRARNPSAAGFAEWASSRAPMMPPPGLASAAATARRLRRLAASGPVPAWSTANSMCRTSCVVKSDRSCSHGRTHRVRWVGHIIAWTKHTQQIRLPHKV